MGTENSGAEILKYQTGRTLAEVPAYHRGLQLALPSGDTVYIAVSATELTFYFHRDLALHYDLELRLTKVAEPNRYWRRSLSHRIVYSRKREAAAGGGLERVVLDALDADEVVRQAHSAVAAIQAALSEGTVQIEGGKPTVEEAREFIVPLVAKAATFDAAAARADARKFHLIYGGVAVLPPDEYNAFVVQATAGCSYGHCTFCKLYEGVEYHAKTTAEFELHVQAAMAYHGAALCGRRSIFLGEANALRLPQDVLAENLRVLQRYFELPLPTEQHVPASWWLGNAKRFDGVASFLDVFTGPRRDVPDWEELRRLGLRRVYIGMETGDDELLAWLQKPAKGRYIVRTVRALKNARLHVGVIVLLGAGGRQFAANHVRGTLKVLNALPLERGDYIYFSPLMIFPGGPYDAKTLAQQIEPLSAAEIDHQEQEIRAELRYDPRHGLPHIARYNLETFAY